MGHDAMVVDNARRGGDATFESLSGIIPTFRLGIAGRGREGEHGLLRDGEGKRRRAVRTRCARRVHEDGCVGEGLGGDGEGWGEGSGEHDCEADGVVGGALGDACKDM